MRISLALCIAINLLGSSLLSQTIFLKPDLERTQIHGKVKLINESTYEVEIVDGEIVKGEGKGMHWQYEQDYAEIEFDSNGYMKRYADLRAPGDTIWVLTKSLNRALRIVEEKLDTKDELFPNTQTYYYDDEYRLVKRTDSVNGVVNSTSQVKYDTTNQYIIEEHKTVTKRGDISIYIRKYSKKTGRLLESLSTYNNDQRDQKKYHYSDDGTYHWIETIKPDGRISQKVFHKFDDTGKKIEIKSYFYTKHRVDEKLERFVYKIDGKGNWVFRINYLGDVPRSINERIIEYFQ